MLLICQIWHLAAIIRNIDQSWGEKQRINLEQPNVAVMESYNKSYKRTVGDKINMTTVVLGQFCKTNAIGGQFNTSEVFPSRNVFQAKSGPQDNIDGAQGPNLMCAKPLIVVLYRVSNRWSLAWQWGWVLLGDNMSR